MFPALPTPGRSLRRAAALAAGVALAATAVLATASPAAADAAPKSHDPVGAITATSSAGKGVQVTGWAYDPDAKANDVYLIAKIDGTKTVASVTTSKANATVSKKYGLGRTPGYTLTVPLPAGAKSLCMVAQNQGAGTSGPVGCLRLPLGTTWTSAQLTAHQPAGKITGYSATGSGVRFRGYATDPDWTSAHLRTVLYVDGQPMATRYTTGRPNPAVSGAGPHSAFDISVPVAAGTHVGCVWVVNIGVGKANTFLGCKAVDTRGKAGTGPLPSPAVNKAALAEALKHKGQAYSWGATGPKSFDCSGLVVYSYAKAVAAVNKTLPAGKKISMSIPRVSADQARAARLIPASRAVPGDLVFTFDSEGDVYHVGIYVKPGQAFAAIDYGYGVNYQNIWDPASTLYGSFTHT